MKRRHRNGVAAPCVSGGAARRQWPSGARVRTRPAACTLPRSLPQHAAITPSGGLPGLACSVWSSPRSFRSRPRTAQSRPQDKLIDLVTKEPGPGSPRPAAANVRWRDSRPAPPSIQVDRSKPLNLSADNLTYDTAGNRVIASGNVQIFYNDYALTADEVIYDQSASTVTAKRQRSPAGAQRQYHPRRRLYADRRFPRRLRPRPARHHQRRDAHLRRARYAP